MGSKIWKPQTAKDFYILGLWLADGYWWFSSVGLCSSDKRLLKRFEAFLHRLVPNSPLKRRVYKPGKYKVKRRAEHVYVKNRELTRLFLSLKKVKKLAVPKNFIPAYLAGRIDGDGHVDRKHRSGIRIAYSNQVDAQRDRSLIGKNNTSLYCYKDAGTWVLYLRKKFREEVVPKMKPYCLKLAP